MADTLGRLSLITLIVAVTWVVSVSAGLYFSAHPIHQETIAVDISSILKIVVNALLPALMKSLDTPAVRDAIMAMIQRLLGQAQAMAIPHATGRFGKAAPYVPATPAEAHVLALPPENWQPETIIRVIREHAE